MYWFPFLKYSSEFQGQMKIMFLFFFWFTSILFPVMTAVDFILISGELGFHLFHISYTSF